jgi:hypothetical protein
MEIGLKYYVDEDNRFSMPYPQTWEFVTGSEFNTTFVLFKNEEKDISFCVSIAEAAQDHFDSYYEYVKSLNERTHSNYSVVSEETTEINGMPAKKLIFVYNQSQSLNKDIVFVLYGGGLGWQITFSLLNIPDAAFNSSQPIIGTIMDNFQVHEISRGEKAAEHIQAIKREIKTKEAISNSNKIEKASKKKRHKELRLWAVGLIVSGVISFFINALPVDTPEIGAIIGLVTIGVGIIELIFPIPIMYLVNGFLLIIIGIINAVFGFISLSPTGYIAALQIGWGVQQFSRYNE